MTGERDLSWVVWAWLGLALLLFLSACQGHPEAKPPIYQTECRQCAPGFYCPQECYPP